MQLGPKIAGLLLDDIRVAAVGENPLQPGKGRVGIAGEGQRRDPVPFIGRLAGNAIGGRRARGQPVVVHAQVGRALTRASGKEGG